MANRAFDLALIDIAAIKVRVNLLFIAPAGATAGDTGCGIVCDLINAHMKAFTFAPTAGTVYHGVSISLAGWTDRFIARSGFKIAFPFAVPTVLAGKRNISFSITLTTDMPLCNSFRHAGSF
jgi:hypothetical protein